jgi:hypothetical protein
MFRMFGLFAMNAGSLRELLKKLDSTEPAEDDHSVTRLLQLAVVLNEWNYPCVSHIECGLSVQDAGYVGDVKLHLSNRAGLWEITVRPSNSGNLITFIDPNGAVDNGRESALKKIFENCGYVYVPPRLLRERYPGHEYETWFDRFFSWG